VSSENQRPAGLTRGKNKDSLRPVQSGGAQHMGAVKEHLRRMLDKLKAKPRDKGGPSKKP
jgi:hypothetical protein